MLAEYLLTNDQLIPALQPVFDAFAAAGGDPAMLRPVLGVDRRYLERAFAVMEETYGSIENYVGEGLGLDAAERTELRSLLLLDPPAGP